MREYEGGLDPPALAHLFGSGAADGAALAFGCEAPPVQRGEGERITITALVRKARPVCFADGGVQRVAGAAEPVHAEELERAVEVAAGLRALVAKA